MTRTKIRVLHLITELDAGGAQTALLRLLEQTKDSRIQPRVVCLYNENKVVAQQIRQLGISVTGLGMSQSWRVDALWRLYRLLRAEPVDILHCWMFHADILGRLVGRIVGVPAVITSRRSMEVGGARREQIKRWTAWLDDRVVAVCEMARTAEISRTGVAPEKVRTIYNGIDSAPYHVPAARGLQMRQALTIPGDALVVGTVGRLHPVKGHRYLLQAWPTVRQQIPQ
ncbi:MAG TPA: glycosyltransferase, partial [Caldilineaceae bacterium]|nr:glycosyltransferase [Caldilineaceae bacterium]